MSTQKLGSVIVASVVLSIAATLVVLYLVHTAAPFLFSDQSVQNEHRSTSPHVPTELTSDTIIPDIVEAVTPAVVSITITADVPIIDQYYENYSPFGDLFGDFGFRVPREIQRGTKKQVIGGGTGFFVSADGYIITNRHVVDLDTADYSIVTNDGKEYAVDVVARDPSLDVAILKTRGSDTFPYLEFGDDATVRLGSTVIAIGNALAEFPNSVSVGVVSGLSRNIVAGDGLGFSETLENVIQTDAGINQGNSGGPLLNIQGKVIGVNVAVAGNSENIGFALPVDLVESVFKSVKEHGEIVRPFVGIRYVQIDALLKETNNLPVDYGILVSRGATREERAIIPDSPADKAGLEENDIILDINGTKLDGSTSFAHRIRQFAVGDTIELTILHDGEEKKVSVTLDKAPER